MLLKEDGKRAYLFHKFWKVLKYDGKTVAAECKVVAWFWQVDAGRLVRLQNTTHE